MGTQTAIWLQTLVLGVLVLGVTVFTNQTNNANAIDQAEQYFISEEPRDGEIWMSFHNELVQKGIDRNTELLFIGDSITNGWHGEGFSLWDEYYHNYNAINLGIGSEKIEHLLWRLRHGSLRDMSPKVAVLLIGTNNSEDNTDYEIGIGMMQVVKELRIQLPETKILLLGIFPSGENPDATREKINDANTIASFMADDEWVHYLDIGHVFLEEDGTISPSLMPDFLHLSKQGYARWAEAMNPKLMELLKSSS